MKKSLFLLAFVFSFYSPARAEKLNIQEVVQSSWTVNIVSVSSFTPINVDSATISMQQRVFVAIQNLDVTNKVYCSQSPNVTIATGLAVPENAGLISIPLGYGTNNYAQPSPKLKIYCITANTTGPSNVAVIQGF